MFAASESDVKAVAPTHVENILPEEYKSSQNQFHQYDTWQDDVKVVRDFPEQSREVLSKLTPEQVARFHEDGYLVIPNFATRDQLLALARAAEAEVSGFNTDEYKSVFSTSPDKQHGKSDDYFLDSGDCTRCFYEEGVFDEAGNLKVPKLKSINKIGHAMHAIHPVFRAYSNSLPHHQVVKSLGYKRPLIAQSMYIFKQPFVGGKVGCHQDNTFLYTVPTSCIGLWIALDDATQTNGCLWVIPGSHKGGTKTRYRLKTEEVTAENGEKRTVRKLYFDPPITPGMFREEGGIPVEVKAGSLVLLHGDVVHYSYANTSPNQRHAYTIHVVEGDAGWAKDNWMQKGCFLPLDGSETQVSE